jgi:hypothetical protein
MDIFSRPKHVMSLLTSPTAEGGMGLNTVQVQKASTVATDSACGVLYSHPVDLDHVSHELFQLLVRQHIYGVHCNYAHLRHAQKLINHRSAGIPLGRSYSRCCSGRPRGIRVCSISPRCEEGMEPSRDEASDRFALTLGQKMALSSTPPVKETPPAASPSTPQTPPPIARTQLAPATSLVAVPAAVHPSAAVASPTLPATAPVAQTTGRYTPK